jgi:tetratricopeptide (TPR) repeat protein
MSSGRPTSSRSSTRSGSPVVLRSPGTRRLAGVWFCALLLCACATPPQTRALLAEPQPGLPLAAELTNVPFYPQERYQCGPAALATVLQAQSIDVTPEELVSAVYVPALHGSLTEEITAAARRYGMLAYPLSPSIADLFLEIAHGYPVLIFQNLGTGWYPLWHFAVVVGYDLTNHEVVLRSGVDRRRRTTLANLERTWSAGGNWARVILPAGNIPATARPLPYLQAAHDLETSGQAAAAHKAYQAATRRWPDAPRTWLALGNSDYAAADYTAAVAAFRQAVSLAPGDPQGWNNLAYALLRTSCPVQARIAAGCARQRAPDDPDYQATVAEITAQAGVRDAPHCASVDCDPSD